MSKKNCEIICTLDRIEDSKGVLKFIFSDIDVQEIKLARRYLPKDVNEGDVLCVEFMSCEKSQSKKQDLAKQVLEEILNGD